MRDDTIYSFQPIWPGWKVTQKLGHGPVSSVFVMERTDPMTGTVERAAVKHISWPPEYVLSNPDLPGNMQIEYAQEDRRRLSGMIDRLRAMGPVPGIMPYDEVRFIDRPDGIGFDLFLRTPLLQSLHDLRDRQGTLSREQVIRMGIDTARGLAVLHGQGLLHMNIRPGNIFMKDDGSFCLGDCCLSPGLLTRFDLPRGFSTYLTPEIYLGAAAPDASADLYALGMILYRFLNNGMYPFMDAQHPTPGEALSKIMKGETPPPPSQADPALAEVVMKCIAFKPEDRWQSARELADALEACAAGKYYPQREPELERMAIIYGPPRDYGTQEKPSLSGRLSSILRGRKRRG